MSHQICSLALAQALSSRRFLFIQNDVILFNGSQTRCNSWPWQAFLVVGSLARCTPWYTGSQGGSLACTGSRVLLCAFGVLFVLPTAVGTQRPPEKGCQNGKNGVFGHLYSKFSPKSTTFHNFAAHVLVGENLLFLLV